MHIDTKKKFLSQKNFTFPPLYHPLPFRYNCFRNSVPFSAHLKKGKIFLPANKNEQFFFLNSETNAGDVISSIQSNSHEFQNCTDYFTCFLVFYAIWCMSSVSMKNLVSRDFVIRSSPFFFCKSSKPPYKLASLQSASILILNVNLSRINHWLQKGYRLKGPHRVYLISQE